MPSSLLSEWEQYYEEEPFGQIRQDYLLGMLVLAVFNALRSNESEPITLQDILYPRLHSQPTQEEQVAEDLAFVESLIESGKVIDLRKRRGLK